MQKINITYVKIQSTRQTEHSTLPLDQLVNAVWWKGLSFCKNHHIHTLCGRNTEVIPLNLVVHRVTTWRQCRELMTLNTPFNTTTDSASCFMCTLHKAHSPTLLATFTSRVSTGHVLVPLILTTLSLPLWNRMGILQKYRCVQLQMCACYTKTYFKVPVNVRRYKAYPPLWYN